MKGAIDQSILQSGRFLMTLDLLNRRLTDVDNRQTFTMPPDDLVAGRADATLDKARIRHGTPPWRPGSCASDARPSVPGASLCVPVVPGQQGPDRRRQIAHRGIQANAPGRIALRTRFSAIRPNPSIYERRREWDIEQLFRLIKTEGLQLEDSRLESADRLLKLTAIAAKAAVITLQLVQARDGQTAEPASLAFTPVQIKVLAGLGAQYEGRTKLQSNPHPAKSLAWAAWIIARLGGWDGYPRTKMLWGLAAARSVILKVVQHLCRSIR